MASSAIYLDYQAGTPVDPEIFESAAREMALAPGNPSSSHSFGRRAQGLLFQARKRVSACFGVDPEEVILTSGATESISLALLGIARHLFAHTGVPKILASGIEHPAVKRNLELLASRGAEIHFLTHAKDGSIDLAEVESQLKGGIDLVTVMLANNEIGTIFPIAALSELTNQYGALFLCDASQGLQQERAQVANSDIALISCSGHKVHGLSGSGALIVRKDIQQVLTPLIHGGGQERGLRAGTQNLLGAITLGIALERLVDSAATDGARVRDLQSRLLNRLLSANEGCSLVGPPVEERLLGNLMVSFEGVEGDMIVANCPELAISTGSACSSGVPGPSQVLEALPIDSEVAEGAIRIGLGRFTTADEVERAAEMVTGAVTRVRSTMGLSGELV